MQRLFLIAMAAVVTLSIALGLFLYVSLVPYFSPIGKVAAGVVITGLVCVAVLMCAFTYSKVGILLAHRQRERLHSRLIVSGEVVVLPNPDGSFAHLSAMHEAAKIPRVLPAPKDEEPRSDDDTIIDLYRHGSTLQTIMDATGLKYNKVQRVVSDAKKRGVLS